jgi:hypothetical protein
MAGSALATVALLGLIARRAALFPAEPVRKPNSVEPILNAMLDRIAAREPVAIFGEFAQLSPSLLDFRLLAREPDVRLTEWGDVVQSQIDSTVARLRANVRWLEIVERGRGTRMVAHSPTLPWAGREGESNETVLGEIVTSLRPSTFLVLTVDASSPFFTPDYIRTVRRGDEYAAILARQSVRLEETIRFDDLGVTLLRFERQEQSSAVPFGR